MEYNSIKEFTEKIKTGNIFSWFFKDSDKIKGMIISPDTDGFISALLLNNFYGWAISGFYDGKIMAVSSEIDFVKEKEKYFFVDIEILRENIKSVGHHILLYNAKEKNLFIDKIKNTCMQPNNWRNKDVKNNFEEKYPFGTFHLLISILYYLDSQSKVFNFDSSKAVIPAIYVDGVFKNLFNYPENCLDWLKYLADNNKNHPLEKLLGHPTTPKDLMLLMSKFFDDMNDIWATKQKRSRGKISLSKDIDGQTQRIKQNIVDDFTKYLEYLAQQFNYKFSTKDWAVVNNKLNILKFDKEIKAVSKGEYVKLINKKPLNFAVTSKSRKGLEYTLDSNKYF